MTTTTTPPSAPTRSSNDEASTPPRPLLPALMNRPPRFVCSPSNYELAIEIATPNLIQGFWFDSHARHEYWKPFKYTRKTETLWDGEFTYVNNTELTNALRQNMQNVDNRVTERVASILKADQPISFFEYDVTIFIENEGDIVRYRGSGKNRFGTFTLDGTSEYLLKDYNTIYSAKKKRPRLANLSVTAEYNKIRIAGALRSTFRDAEFELERLVLEGQVNFQQVLDHLGTEKRRNEFKATFFHYSLTARERTDRRQRIRQVKRDNLMNEFKKMKTMVADIHRMLVVE